VKLRVLLHGLTSSLCVKFVMFGFAKGEGAEWYVREAVVCRAEVFEVAVKSCFKMVVGCLVGLYGCVSAGAACDRSAAAIRLLFTTHF
jgi:hypothetical protein